MCPETDWKTRVGKQGYVFMLTDFKTRCFNVSFLASICVNNYFETENFWNKSMHKHFVNRACYIREKTMVSYLKVNLETNLFLIWSCSTVDWDCLSIFSEPFPQKETVVFLLPASRTCLIHRQDFLRSFLFAQSRKILPKFSIRSVILKQQREKLCNQNQSKCENDLGYYIMAFSINLP